jgi:hypothetical protein
MATDLVRIHRIVEQTVDHLQLDLKGTTVLTELGSGNFLFTPLIALMAGAEKVYAWTKDSPYGKGADLVTEIEGVLRSLNISGHLSVAVNERPLRHVEEADIITNLGMIRPIDGQLISRMRSTAVIPYMCEAWELREGDVDVQKCKERNIRVAGTWENHPSVGVFDYCGALALKLIMEAGYEIRNNHILIISPDHFGEVAERDLLALKATITHKNEWKDVTPADLEKAELVYFADYSSRGTAVITGETIAHLQRNGIGIVHLCGGLDTDGLATKGVRVYPAKKGYPKRMTQTLAYLGPTPLIRLHAAGLKVAELLLKGKESELVQRL